MRVYVPATTTDLRALAETSALRPGLTAFAVTPGLRAWYVDDDIEELEYAALLEAARASLRLVQADPAAARRRVVIALDVPDAEVSVRDDLDRGVVKLAVPVELGAIASLHVDDADAQPVVGEAAELIDAADLGEEAAQERVDDAEGFELSWYATQELTQLLDGL